MYRLMTRPLEMLIDTTRDPNKAGEYSITETQKKDFEELANNAGSSLEGVLININTLGETISCNSDETNRLDHSSIQQIGFLVSTLAKAAEACNFIEGEANFIVENATITKRSDL